ncbi:MAG: hypothetical protein IPK65_07530 [Gammaproteobacteria bacterium]|nr:hypothetical protein [Gammaproteobacteria bacterium]
MKIWLVMKLALNDPQHKVYILGRIHPGVMRSGIGRKWKVPASTPRT